MIPYFQWNTIVLGPFTIYVWGLCVAIGIAAAFFLARWFARQLVDVAGKQISDARLVDLSAWVVFAGLIGARLGYVITEPGIFLQNPIEIIMLQHGGMSITGALVLGGLTAILFMRRWKLSVLDYLDVAAFALPLGMACGRVGCFCIYDHPGIATHSSIGQEYIDGVTRYNLGFILAIHAALLSVLLFVLYKRTPASRPRPTGFYTVVFLLGYSIPRFFLDFLRATDLPGADPRYFGLTFAQYIALISIVGACWLWYTRVHEGTKKKSKYKKN